MIRAVTGNGHGGKLVILGLDAENVRRLTHNEPILVKGETIGMPDDTLIVFGETLDGAKASLARLGIQLPEVH